MRLSQKQSHGLSPLTRGTHTQNPTHLLFYRFIPADAGNTNPANLHFYEPTVYPR
ncbi:hypothetical protein EAMG_01129 [Escherichia coli M056]|nr:hypothetical protein EAMG_01129 [Escherichia coli M056]